MTRPDRDALSRYLKALTLVALILGLIATLRSGTRVVATELLGLESQGSHAADIVRVDSTHRADIDRLERLLVCALWNLPTGCKSTLAPRIIP